MSLVLYRGCLIITYHTISKQFIYFLVRYIHVYSRIQVKNKENCKRSSTFLYEQRLSRSLSRFGQKSHILQSRVLPPVAETTITRQTLVAEFSEFCCVKQIYLDSFISSTVIATYLKNSQRLASPLCFQKTTIQNAKRSNFVKRPAGHSWSGKMASRVTMRHVRHQTRSSKQPSRLPTRFPTARSCCFSYARCPHSCTFRAR